MDVDMNVIEWLIWRWDLRRLRRTCERRGHDITGPDLTLGGWYIYACTRCSYRFRADRTIEGCNDAAGSEVAQVRRPPEG